MTRQYINLSNRRTFAFHRINPTPNLLPRFDVLQQQKHRNFFLQLFSSYTFQEKKKPTNNNTSKQQKCISSHY